MAVEQFTIDSYKKTGSANITRIEGNKIILDKTIFYPSGGGQEHDTGYFIQDDGAFKVEKVKRENGEIIHYVEPHNNLKLSSVNMQLDWERRYKFMRHHTMLHVLSSVLNRNYNALCTGNQINVHKSRIDFNNVAHLTDNDWRDVIKETNREIQSAHKVSSRLLPRELASDVSNMAKTVINLIPSSVREIRLVKIGEIDEQPCGGTHVKNTKEIGEIFLEKVKSKGKGITRLDVRAV
ncbi:Ala-tRNA(Pro) hydrolase [Lentibacillus persicus]|uniref:Ala-tRNA(Pro) hydrolase n=1 Tax=Lentibacillus persicus TaxID=640948 RepID=A0A1I1W4U8_9BACI|nr:alanyl-tRNA editing protein [Lentibacillus persicus]SFD88353.1 Ala-tRNA(Pro) hydrolase [Lentibacillus persicus]